MKQLLKKVRSWLVAPVLAALQPDPIPSYSGMEIQVLLSLKYRELLRSGVTLPEFDDIGFRVYSDNEEDGILLYIFSLIGTVNKRLVDIGSAAIDGSNCANLIINHGWLGLLFDGNDQAIAAANTFYAKHLYTKKFPPTLVPSWITVENINIFLTEQGFVGEIDLLSIDIDGVDYWIWKAIDCIAPRVVVVEYQDILGPDRALTVPYRPDFRRDDYPVNANVPLYVGASLPAFVKLARTKGYRLVGCNRYGYNAFFVRSGIGEDCLPEVDAGVCFRHPLNVKGMIELYPLVKDMEWVDV